MNNFNTVAREDHKGRNARGIFSDLTPQFSGRIGPMAHFVSLFFLLFFFVAVIGAAELVKPYNHFVYDALTILSTIFYLVCFFSLKCRRLHDMGWTGWVILIPIFGALISFCAFFVPGDLKENKYGCPPLGNRKNLWILFILTICLIVVTFLLMSLGELQESHIVGSSSYNYLVEHPS